MTTKQTMQLLTKPLKRQLLAIPQPLVALAVQFAILLVSVLIQSIQYCLIDKHDSALTLAKPVNLLYIAKFCKMHSQTRLTSVSDIIGFDYLNSPTRFRITYTLLSPIYSNRLRLTLWTTIINPVPSLTSIFTSTNWLERELWDLFGIVIAWHPDMRRIFTDYGFAGHPLRKDFPLSGFTELAYNDRIGAFKTQKVSLAQDFRQFFGQNPWARS